MSKAGHGVTPALLRLVEGWSLPGIVAAFTVLVALVAWIDVATGWEVSFSIFYLIPVGLGSWRGGKAAAVVFSLICAIAWFLADAVAGHEYSRGWIPYWNSAVRFGLFLTSGLTLAALRSSLHRANELARIDSLTGLANPRAFHEELAYHTDFARQHRDPLTVASIDLDNFKDVNDTRGHEAGDRALVGVAAVLRQRLRSVDLLARLGGDEFAVLLPRTGDAEALRLLEDVRSGVQEAMIRESLPVTASIGVVTTRDRVQASDLLRAADEALYEAKSAGRNRVQVRRLAQPGTDGSGTGMAESRRSPHLSARSEGSTAAQAQPEFRRE